MADPRIPNQARLAAVQADTGITVNEVIAVVLCGAWLIGMGLFLQLAFRGTPNGSLDGFRSILGLFVMFMPVAIVWLAAMIARTARLAREDTHRLQAAVDALRQSYLADRQAGSSAVIARPTPRVQATALPDEQAPPTASFQTSRTAPDTTPPVTAPTAFSAPTADEGDPQPSLALGSEAQNDGPMLDRDDMIRALNFPNDENDQEGFLALRGALKARQARQLIQAAQDVLTLLSQDGIYMDDLTPDRARPEVWRRFAQGERGRTVAALGGIRDKECLALLTARTRDDLIFRDSAHHFLRNFDRMLAEFEPDASDAQISHLSETRSARAFMLLGRVAGTFD